MDWRRVIAVVSVLALTVASGCAALDGPSDGAPATESGGSADGTPSPTIGGTYCPPLGEIRVFLPPSVPENATVFEWSGDTLPNNTFVYRALTDAHPPAVVTPGHDRDSAVELASIQGAEVADTDDEIDPYFGGESGGYVRFENVTYRLEYLTIEC